MIYLVRLVSVRGFKISILLAQRDLRLWYCFSFMLVTVNYVLINNFSDFFPDIYVAEYLKGLLGGM